MSENNVQINLQKRTSNKKLFVPLAIIVAVLIIANIILVSLAFFSDKAYGESIITFGSVETEAYVMNGSSKSTVITLDNNNLIAGAVTTKDLHIDVTGKNNCYVRLTGEFRIAVDGTNYVNVSDLISFSLGTTTNWKLCEDGKYYYTAPLNGTESGNASKITVPIKFTVSENFGNSNLDGTSVYENKPYSILITIQACQSRVDGTENYLGSGSAFDYTKWIEN